MRQLRPARKQAVARVRAGTHDYPPPVPDLFILVYHPLCLQDRHEHVLGTVGHTVPTRGMFSGTILYFRYKVTLRHVTSRHVTSPTMYQLPCYHPSMQSCYLLPKFGSSPEFGVFQEIAQKIAQKILWYFKIGQKRPKKLPNDTKTLKKLPK